MNTCTNKVVLSHPTGNSNVRAAAEAFIENGLLSEFYTTIACFPRSTLDYLSKLKPLSEIRRRHFHPQLKPKTRTFPWREMVRLMASRIGASSLTNHETGPFCIDAVYQDMDRRVANRLNLLKGNQTSIVYSYEDGAYYSFRVAKQLGMKCYYDLPIGYWRSARKYMQLEKQKWPEWAATLTGLDDSLEKLTRKDEELRLADKIFVGSHFTAKTLRDFPGRLAPIQVIPYGFPGTCADRKYCAGSSRRLKMLFAGSLSQRKGIADLLTAVEHFGTHLELTIVGQKVTAQCGPLDLYLRKHRWFPTMRNDLLLELMREHDVLVFPSLFEGFGLVITEAMSQGTPVITTERTIGPDIIRNGENGWLVEAGSTEHLIAAIEKLLLNRRLVAQTGRAALETAKLRPWEAYKKELTDAVLEG